MKWLEVGIISPGDTGTWASPGFLIKQKSGHRFVVNLKFLNSFTEPFAFPMPRIYDILLSLRSGKFFSVLDCRKGYLQIALDEQSKNLTGFVVHFGIFKFNRVPFGLCMIMVKLLGHLEFFVFT